MHEIEPNTHSEENHASILHEPFSFPIRIAKKQQEKYEER